MVREKQQCVRKSQGIPNSQKTGNPEQNAKHLCAFWCTKDDVINHLFTAVLLTTTCEHIQVLFMFCSCGLQESGMNIFILLSGLVLSLVYVVFLSFLSFMLLLFLLFYMFVIVLFKIKNKLYLQYKMFTLTILTWVCVCACVYGFVVTKK